MIDVGKLSIVAIFAPIRSFIACCLILASTLPLHAQSAANQSGLLGDLPVIDILDAQDIKIYRQIFAAQDKGDWASSKQLQQQLINNLLLGHVEAHRLLHPKYKSSYQELANWLKKYNDHPQASLVYKLALGRKPNHVNTPPVKALHQVIKGGNPDMGQTNNIPAWKSALDAWIKGNFASATRLFEKVAQNYINNPWVASAAYFWAGRGYLKMGNPQQYITSMQRAAEYPRTFYGQLAIQILGIKPTFDWSEPVVTSEDLHLIGSYNHGKRALALLQIGQLDLAEEELLILRSQAKHATTRALVGLSQKIDFSGLSFQTGVRNQNLLPDDNHIMISLYPVPDWTPKGGFKIDPALIYAVMRQESSFNPSASSHKGASGLMQVMPSTAAFVRNKKSGHYNKNDLLIPEVNLSIAQDYLANLLIDEHVNGDLILAMIAYNAGPSHVPLWKKRFSYSNDPLLFIERIPYKETRLYVQRVLANLWIYRNRLGQESASLKELASGTTPVYQSQDPRITAHQLAFRTR